MMKARAEAFPWAQRCWGRYRFVTLHSLEHVVWLRCILVCFLPLQVNKLVFALCLTRIRWQLSKETLWFSHTDPKTWHLLLMFHITESFYAVKLLCVCWEYQHLLPQHFCFIQELEKLTMDAKLDQKSTSRSWCEHVFFFGLFFISGSAQS